jgi:hypothetical protein
MLRRLTPRVGPGNIYTIILPLAAVNEGAEMIDGQNKGEAEADKRKHHKDHRVKVGFGYPADNPQSKKKNIDGTDAVQHGKKKK